MRFNVFSYFKYKFELVAVMSLAPGYPAREINSPSG